MPRNSIGRLGGRSRAARLVTTVIVAVVASPAVAHADPLTGETFSATDVVDNSPVGTCVNPSDSTFSFTARGTAAGPYPGTFVETGTATVTFATGGTVSAFSAHFDVSDLSGQVIVSGDKQLSVGGPGFCDPTTQIGFDAVVPVATYTATTPTGADNGDSVVSVVATQQEANPGGLGSFSESFTSTAPPPPPPGPTSKADCKNGGYQKYGFKSQGECIASLK